MTLCAVLRHPDGRLEITTDSRVTVAAGKSADVAVKVAVVPLRLERPKGRDQSAPMVTLERDLGVAVVGSMVTTMSTVELLRSVLANLQFVPGRADRSLRGIAELAAIVLRRISAEVCQHVFENGRGIIILAGLCPVSSLTKAISLTVTLEALVVDVTVEEIDLFDGPVFFGSGAPAARALHESHPGRSVQRIVRDVAEDPQVPSVGGNIQYGEVTDGHFVVRGVRSLHVDHAERTARVGFYLAGIELFGGEDAFSESGFVPRKRFIDPFAQEIDALLALGYDVDFRA